MCGKTRSYRQIKLSGWCRSTRMKSGNQQTTMNAVSYPTRTQTPGSINGQASPPNTIFDLSKQRLTRFLHSSALMPFVVGLLSSWSPGLSPASLSIGRQEDARLVRDDRVVFGRRRIFGVQRCTKIGPAGDEHVFTSHCNVSAVLFIPNPTYVNYVYR